MKTRKTCWTCSERRVACDGTKPACSNCTRGKRQCQGYGTRLSWPKAGDKKRSIVLLQTHAQRRQRGATPFLNTTTQDVLLYYYPDVRITRYPVIRQPTPWKAADTVAVNAMDLVAYFQDIAHPSLNTFVGESIPLRDFLLKLSLQDTSLAGRASLNALLALSELHRAGYTDRALQLKVLSLQSLSAATNTTPLTGTAATQLVAASMLLGAFDTFTYSISGEWLAYTKGAARIVSASGLLFRQTDDVAHLVNWVRFHDVLSEFPTYHWRPRVKSASPDANTKLEVDNDIPLQTIPTAAHLETDMINLLSEVYATLQHVEPPASKDYQDRLASLQQRVEHITQNAPSASPDTAAALYVWQKATKIYLTRATQMPHTAPADLELLIDEAFRGPIQDCSCPHFFPLFIVACEARTDARRQAILELVDRGEKIGIVRSKAWLRNVMQDAWVQMDLHADEDLLVDYVGMISRVIGSAGSIPSFA